MNQKSRRTKVAAAGPRTDVPANARRSILAFLKHRHGGGVADVAAHLHISYEGARQHLTQLEKEGKVEKRVLRAARAAAGRPLARYVLTRAGDHLFPKNYDELTVELIDALTERLGPQALKQVLTAFTDKRVQEWAPRLENKSLKERVTALQEIYGGGDPYMSVEIGRNGIRLIERNCPFLNVATRRPALCSVTVSALERLLGVSVVREEKFQAGNGRCVFRVLPDRPIDTRRFRFSLEPEGPDSSA
ncbi:MAG TPA: FaeA/PapI family transcriptional regulator [Burkholderiales bacterium]